MMLPLDTVNPLRKSKVQKDFSLHKRFLENFGVTLEEVLHYVLHYSKCIFIVSRVLFFEVYYNSV